MPAVRKNLDGALRAHGVLLLLVALPGAGCGRHPAAAPTRAASIVIAPNAATIPAGSSQQFAVQVNDALGHPVGGAEIHYAAMPPTLLNSNPTGLVRSLGPLGHGKLVVTSDGIRAEVEVVVEAGPLTTIAKLKGDAQVAEIGAALPEPLEVHLLDGAGNPIPDVRVHFIPPDGGTVAPPLSLANAAGNATSIWTLASRSGEQTLTAFAEGGPTVTFSARALSGPAARVEAPAPPGRVVAGSNISATVTVADRAGNAKVDSVIVWKLIEGNGKLAAATSRTNADGVALVRWTTGPSAGVNRLEARAADVPDSPATLTLTTIAGPPTQVTAQRGAHQKGRAGSAAPEKLAALVRDSNGNPARGAVVTFTVTSGDGRIADPVAISDSQGVATAGVWILGTGSNEASATVEGIAAGALFHAATTH